MYSRSLSKPRQRASSLSLVLVFCRRSSSSGCPPLLHTSLHDTRAFATPSSCGQSGTTPLADEELLAVGAAPARISASDRRSLSVSAAWRLAQLLLSSSTSTPRSRRAPLFAQQRALSKLSHLASRAVLARGANLPAATPGVAPASGYLVNPLPRERGKVLGSGVRESGEKRGAERERSTLSAGCVAKSFARTPAGPLSRA